MSRISLRPRRACRAALPEIAGTRTSDTLTNLETPEAYLGIAETFRIQLLSAAGGRRE